MRNYLLIILVIISQIGLAQKKKNDTTVAQLYGIIIDSDSLYPLPGARIFVKNTSRGDISKYNGCFSLPVLHNDTVVVKLFTYKTMKFIVPDSGSTYEIVFKMQMDTLSSEPIIISFLPSEQQFIQEVLNAKISYQKYQYALMNLDQEKQKYIQARNASLGMPSTSSPILTSRNYTTTTIPLLDPFAWRRAIKDIKNNRKLKEEELKKYKSDSSYK